MKKRLFMIACLLSVASAAAAQKLVIGEKAPDLKVKEWIYGAPAASPAPRYIEFFQSTSAPCLERLAPLNDMALRNKDKLSVVIISRQDAAPVRTAVGGGRNFYTGLDDAGKTFAAYGVQYVPFAAILDAKGRVVWFGNPDSLTEVELQKYIK